MPKHQTAVAVSAGAALSLGIVGYAMGRRRRSAEKGRLATALGRAPELDLSPFFRFLGVWMLYRVAIRD